MVDLYDCVQQFGEPSSPNCIPRVADATFQASHGQPVGASAPYKFHFLTLNNQQRFEADPISFTPKTGGYCAFSLTGFDRSVRPRCCRPTPRSLAPHAAPPSISISNGAGFWCSCPTHEDGYAYLNGTAYFFLFQGAKDAFLKDGKVGSEITNLPILRATPRFHRQQPNLGDTQKVTCVSHTSVNEILQNSRANPHSDL